ncbi:MAG: DUF86 domain-containing protein [Thermoplasmata archaeon]|nr:DUF86 domain-containing protein [Thermoplasmata archaeon]
MSKRGDIEFLKDVDEAIKRIMDYTYGIDYEDILEDTKTQDAVLRNMEIIGEAVKNTSSDFKQKHKKIEWKKIAGMRDKVIHFYFGVNWDIVWDVVNNKLPILGEEIMKLLEEEVGGS